MANMEEENSMVQSEAELISSEDETPVAAKRRRIEEQEEESSEEEMKEEMKCAGTSTQVTHDRITCPISVSVTERTEIPAGEEVHGVTKLRNEIYILIRSTFYAPSVIRVLEDQRPFLFQRNIELHEIQSPQHFGSSEKENCLYVSEGQCIWRMTRETDDQHEIIKWLIIDCVPYIMSISNDGRLLMVNGSSSNLTIYGTDAELIRSFQLPRHIKNPCHAVETSIGNFIIIHYEEEEEEEKEEKEEEEEEGKEKDRLEGTEGKSGSSGIMKSVVSELTSDGQMVIRRFIPSSEMQQLNEPLYLSLDSDDRVFVADRGNHRVILLDSDLKWNRIICPTKEEAEEEETTRIHPVRMCYDGKKKQLIVEGYDGVSVYTLK